VPKDHHTDREAPSKRGVVLHDVHDIRSLTDTGPIALPQQGSSSTGEPKPGA
jgi:hypothetical protein